MFLFLNVLNVSINANEKKSTRICLCKKEFSGFLGLSWTFLLVFFLFVICYLFIFNSNLVVFFFLYVCHLFSFFSPSITLYLASFTKFYAFFTRTFRWVCLCFSISLCVSYSFEFNGWKIKDTKSIRLICIFIFIAV